jgi:hypothetical protein
LSWQEKEIEIVSLNLPPCTINQARTIHLSCVSFSKKTMTVLQENFALVKVDYYLTERFF